MWLEGVQGSPIQPEMNFENFVLYMAAVVPTLLGLRGCVTVLEIAFIGQFVVFVCLDFVHFFFPLGREAHRSANGVSVL